LARIPDAAIERVKAGCSVVAVVRAHGVELKKVGRDWHGRCPFHEDDTPSLVVSPDKGLWHCLGACQVGGSVIDWVMRARGVSFRHAVEMLREGLPATGAPAAGAAPGRSRIRTLSAPVDRTGDDTELLAQVVDFYHRALLDCPDALAWLKQRRIDDPEAITGFRLGFANRTLGLRLPGKQVLAGADLRGRLAELGVFRASGHEHLNGSVVVPVLDEHGTVLDLYGRKIRDDLRVGTPAHLYLPGAHRGVFNVSALAGCAGEVILAESLIDALTFWCAGFRNVTASFGTGGFTDAHRAAFTKAGIGRVLIAYDNDTAGNTAAQALADSLVREGAECLRVCFPPGADANDVAVATDDPGQALGRLLRSARWMGRGPAPAAPAPVADMLAGSSAAVAEPLAGPPGGSPEAPSDPMPITVPEGPSLSGEVHREPPRTDGCPTVNAAGELALGFGERRWRVRGLAGVNGFETLRVNVMVSAPGPGVAGPRLHVDTLDLYSARARAAYIAAAAAELGVEAELVKRDLGRVLLAAEDHAAAAAAAQEPDDAPPPMSEAERAAALGLLRDADLVGRISRDLAATGIVGEATNALVAYLAAVSRKLARPLAVIVQSTSAAGKSTLVDAVLAMVPPEDLVRFSAMTGQSLFYMGSSDLAHKVLAIAEEEGASRAAYALKLLQSDGSLSIASTGKDNASGRLVTHTYSVNGPAAIFLTTTSIEVDPELLNRALVLAVDEDRAQTRAIHTAQRHAQTLAGLLAGAAREEILGLHRNAQRLLEPLSVVNPFAPDLTFADAATRSRRDHMKYLALIAAVTLLHQHQREVRTATVPGADGRTVRYVEATKADVDVADRLAALVLARTGEDLPTGTRRVLDALTAWVADLARQRGADIELVRFTRRQVREALGFGDTQLKVHLARLVDLELVVPHRLDGGGFTYELAWRPPRATDQDAGDGTTTPLRSGFQAGRSGPGERAVGPGRGLVGVPVGPRPGQETPTGKGKPTLALAEDPANTDPGPGDGHVPGPVVVPPGSVTVGGTR
jgi:DNA primase catalytic core